MGPPQRQLQLLSPEDRVIYRKWLRRSLAFYGTALVLLMLAVAANYNAASQSADGGDEAMHTAAITAKK
jgi:hypothetical protein